MYTTPIKMAFTPSGIAKILFALVLFLIMLLSPASNSTQQSKTPNPTREPEQVSTTASHSASATSSAMLTTYDVVSVTDGDTFKVSIDGKTETVRLVGINTPETVDPRRPVQCFGKEASKKLSELLTGKRVALEQDIQQGDRDKYGRLLRFAKLETSEDVGTIMLKEGYAQESLYSSTPHKYRNAYLSAQKEAQDNKRGMWADNVCPTATPKPTIIPTQTPTQVIQPSVAPTPTQTQSTYSCAGPDLDCGDFATHAQAQAFFDGCGFTATYDPMQLDALGVGDGNACESRP